MLIVLLCSFSNLKAQIETNEADTLRKDALKVFMQEYDYIKKEITFINYVRDQKVAHVCIVESSQQTGAGGRKVTFFLTGQNEFSGMNDTISFLIAPDDTQEQYRKHKINTLKMGLMRYVLKTPLAKYVDINFTQPMESEVSIDNWNSWVFRARINGYFDKTKNFTSNSYRGSISANRITEDLKVELNVSYYENSDKFDIDGDIITSVNNSNNFNSIVVKSLGEHWSIGGLVALGSSTYGNKNFYARILPAIEYNVFPYSESTHRQLRLLYAVGDYYYNYTDSTIYDQIEENLLGHELNIGYEIIKNWGSIETSIRWRNYFYDWSKNNLSLNGYVNIKVFKGLSVNVGGFYSLIHDQLNLVKGGATSDEILLRRKELETSYSTFIHFGITYTFGSIYNNVVNPRFGN